MMVLEFPIGKTSNGARRARELRILDMLAHGVSADVIARERLTPSGRALLSELMAEHGAMPAASLAGLQGRGRLEMAPQTLEKAESAAENGTRVTGAGRLDREVAGEARPLLPNSRLSTLRLALRLWASAFAARQLSKVADFDT
jgi:hypothetical protein